MEKCGSIIIVALLSILNCCQNMGINNSKRLLNDIEQLSIAIDKYHPNTFTDKKNIRNV